MTSLDRIELSLSEIEKLASAALGVERCIDLGPAAAGGRYYCELWAGLAPLISGQDLASVIEAAVASFFAARRPALRQALAVWLREQYREARLDRASSCRRRR